MIIFRLLNNIIYKSAIIFTAFILELSKQCFVGTYSSELQPSYIVIEITFANNISFPLYTLQSDIFSNEFCQYIFQQTTLDKLGDYPECHFDANVSQTLITINLGQNASITNNDQLDINTGMINQQGCGATTYYSSYVTGIMTLNVGCGNPTIEFSQEDNHFYSVCEPIKIGTINVQNNGYRSLFNKQLSLTATTATDTTLIDTFITNFNTLTYNIDYIEIPPLTLLQGFQYTIQLQFENFVGLTNTHSIILNTLSTSYSVSMTIDKTLYPYQFYQYLSYEINSNIQFFNCQNQLNSIEENREIVATWYDSTTPANTILRSQVLQSGTKNFPIKIPDFKYSLGTYKLTLQIYLGTETINEAITEEITITYIDSNLSTYIKGGSRKQSNGQPLILQVISKDLDEADITIQSDNIQYQWQCENIIDGSNCLDFLGNVVSLATETTDTIEFIPYFFQPFSMLKFTVRTYITANVIKDISKSVNIYLLDEMYEQLNFEVSNYVNINKVNTNDQFFIELQDYNDNVDDLIFTLDVIYNKQIINQIVQNFSSFQIIVDDILFNPYGLFGEVDLLIKQHLPNNIFTVKNAQVNIQINIPPIGGTITSSPSTGIEINTLFTILLEEIQTQNTPLKYKYGFFLSDTDQLTNIQNGKFKIQQNFMVIQDFTFSNRFQTLLPYCDEDSSGQRNIYFTVLIEDSLGSYYNKTIPILMSQDTGRTITQQLDYMNQIIETQQQYIQDYNRDIIVLSIQYIQLQTSIQSDNNSQFEQLGLTLLHKLEDLSIHFQNLALLRQNLICFSKILNLNTQYISTAYTISQILNLYDFLEPLLSQSITNIDEAYQESFLNGQSVWNKIIINNKEVLDAGIIFIDAYLNLIMTFLQNQFAQNRRNLALSEEQIGQFNEVIDNLLQLLYQMQKSLQQILVANGNIIDYDGNFLKVKIQKLTNQQINNEYLQTPQQGELGFIDQKIKNLVKDYSFDQLHEIDENQIYQSSQFTFKQNPYQYLNNFPYPDQQIYANWINIENDNPDKNLKLNKTFNYKFEIQGGNFTQNVCITRTSTNTWIKDLCDTILWYDDLNQKDFVLCQCKTSALTVLIQDVNSIFNPSGILENPFESMYIWEFKMSYFFFTITFLIFLSILKGNIQDKIDNNDKDLHDIRLTEVQRLDRYYKEKHYNYFKDQDELPINKHTYKAEYLDPYEVKNADEQNADPTNKFNLVGYYNKKAVKSQKRIQNQRQILLEQQELAKINEKPIKELPIQEKTKQDYLSKFGNGFFPVKEDNYVNIEGQQNQAQALIQSRANQTKKEQQKAKQEREKNAQKLLEAQENLQQKKKIDHQLALQEQKEEEIITKKRREPLRQRSIIQGIFIYHEFISIFYYYDIYISRKTRFILYHMKLTILLVLAEFFDSQKWGNNFLAILSIVCSGFFLGLPISFIIMLYDTDKFSLNFLGSFIIFIIYLIMTYLLYIIGIDMTSDVADNWLILYIYSLCFEVFMLQPLVTSSILILYSKALKTNKLWARFVMRRFKQCQTYFRGEL